MEERHPEPGTEANDSMAAAVASSSSEARRESWDKQPGTKRRYKVNRLKRSIDALVGKPKNNSTFQNRPDEYFAHVYVDRNLWQGVVFLAKANGVTRKQVVHQALQAGLSRLLGEAVLEINRRAASQDEDGLPPRRTPLTRELKRLAREKGLEIGDVL
jgi:hypothetical protein